MNILVFSVFGGVKHGGGLGPGIFQSPGGFVPGGGGNATIPPSPTRLIVTLINTWLDAIDFGLSV